VLGSELIYFEGSPKQIIGQIVKKELTMEHLKGRMLFICFWN